VAIGADKLPINHLTVSIIIPVHNGGRAFIRCLKALLYSRTQPDEIIVVANGCRDRSAEIARLSGAQVIDLSQAVGPAAARNAAAGKARGDLLFFVDADVALHPESLGTVRALFQVHPELSACFGSYDDNPPEKNFFSQYKNLFHHFMHQQGQPQATTFWAGCGAVRRTVFAELGGFDESYRQPAIEDIELGYRLIARGFKIRLEKRLQATHLKRWGLASLLKADFLGRALPWSRLILRSSFVPSDLNTKRRYRFSALLVALFVILLFVSLTGAIPLWPATVTIGLLTVLNLDWYLFVFNKKGWSWTIPAVIWHWVYYLYSTIAFLIALGEHFTPTKVQQNQ